LVCWNCGPLPTATPTPVCKFTNYQDCWTDCVKPGVGECKGSLVCFYCEPLPAPAPGCSAQCTDFGGIATCNSECTADNGFSGWSCSGKCCCPPDQQPTATPVPGCREDITGASNPACCCWSNDCPTNYLGQHQKCNVSNGYCKSGKSCNSDEYELASSALNTDLNNDGATNSLDWSIFLRGWAGGKYNALNASSVLNAWPTR